MVIEELYSHRELVHKVIETLSGDIETACIMMTDAINAGNKVLISRSRIAYPLRAFGDIRRSTIICHKTIAT